MTISFLPTLDSAAAALTAPGALFEVVHEPVRGVSLPVFRQRYRSLAEMLDDSLRFGDRTHFVVEDRRVTYREHHRMVRTVASFLACEHGVGKGDRVALFAENGIEWSVAFWAIVSLGAVAVPMNGWWTQAEFLHAWRRSEPVLLLGDEKRLRRLEPECIEAPIHDLDALLPTIYGREFPEPPHVTIAEDDPAVMLFTSGTGGQAKAVLRSHRTEIAFAQCAQFANAHGLARRGLSLEQRPPSVILGTSPFFHISGLGGILLIPLIMGDTVVLLRGRFSPERALAAIERERVTLWTILGGMGPRILAHPDIGKYDLSSVNTVIFGGSTVSESVQLGIRKVFAGAAMNPAIGYGSTETGTVPVGFSGADLVQRPLSTGQVSLLHELQIRDKLGNTLGEGEQGDIWVRSAFVMLGYVGEPQLTAEVLDQQLWLRTGDVGHMEDGFLYINSRARDMILRSAENVSPTEVESCLDAHPAVQESAVFGVDHPIHLQAVGAVVVLREGSTVSPSELAEWAERTLAKFKVPEYWALTYEPLPRNAAGKVMKDLLREKYQERTIR